MSKSKGNVINPDFYIENFGADTLRMYLMFLAPFEQGGDFRDQAVMGVHRFLNRVFNLIISHPELREGSHRDSSSSPMDIGETQNDELQKLLHQTIKKVTNDIENLHYNTAISALMILFKKLEKENPLSLRPWSESDFGRTCLLSLKLLAPFAPHLTEELWRETLGNKTSIHEESWPEWDEALAGGA